MTQHGHQNALSQLLNDFAARDENIRCLSYGVIRKLIGLPQDLFAGYWRDVLGTLLARLPGVGYYVQYHFSPNHSANLWPLPDGIRRMDVVLDGAVEIGFADTDGQNRYVKASPVLFGDEFHLFEHTVAYSLPRGSRTLVDRDQWIVHASDGVITTAGLRGSRNAKLIERIGAVNQTRDEVTRLFVRDPDR